MSNRSNCGPNRSFSSYYSQNSIDNSNHNKLPAIQPNSASIYKSALDHSVAWQPKQHDCANRYGSIKQDYHSMTNPVERVSPSNCSSLSQSKIKNTMIPYDHCHSQWSLPAAKSAQKCGSKFGKTLSNGTTEQTPANRGWASNRFTGFGKSSNQSYMLGKHAQANQKQNCREPPTISNNHRFFGSPSKLENSTGSKTVVRDRELANEILQKAGMSSNVLANDCLEVVTDTPVTKNDDVNCDPNPLCMRKPIEQPECYEQSIVVRHLQPPKPPTPTPIIIREHCAPAPLPQSPIVIRQIPPRPATPPTLIIRECPPMMPDPLEPTIIDREVPPPPPPPRQVIVERLPTPPAKPRPIIFEKWLPYQEPENRPCIIEKAMANETPQPKNVIIQYEGLEPKIQSQCIDEGVSVADPQQFINEKPKGNVEVCYVDQLTNLPEHIKRQLSPQALAAIGVHDSNKQATTNNPHVVRTNPTLSYQQQHQNQTRIVCESTVPVVSPRTIMMMPNDCQSWKTPYTNLNSTQKSFDRNRSIANTCLSNFHDKPNSIPSMKPADQSLINFSRSHYNPWATTYQISYNHRARSLGRVQ